MPRLHWPYALLTAMYCAGIFYLSSRPNLPDAPAPWFEFEGMDKLAHATLYGGLAGVVSLGLWRSSHSIARPWHFAIPIAFALAYGLTDEIHQRYVPNRTFEWLDLLADGVGATIVQAVLCPVLWRQGTTNGTICRDTGMDSSDASEHIE